MPNLRGASPVSRDEGGLSYAARAGGKGEKRIGDVGSTKVASTKVVRGCLRWISQTSRRSASDG